MRSAVHQQFRMLDEREREREMCFLAFPAKSKPKKVDHQEERTTLAIIWLQETNTNAHIPFQRLQNPK
jgi:hypothetical protein